MSGDIQSFAGVIRRTTNFGANGSNEKATAMKRCLLFVLPRGLVENVHGLRTVLRRLEAPSDGDELHHLLVASTRIRHVAQRENLPQQDPEGPENIAIFVIHRWTRATASC